MEKNKKDIVCIGLPAWEGDYLKSTVMLMQELSFNHRVLYVEYAFTFKDLLVALIRRKATPVARILGLKPRLRNLSNHKSQKLYVLTLPPILPSNWSEVNIVYNFLMKINARIIRGSVRRAINKIGLKNVTVVNAFNPGLGLRLENSFNERKLLYYCYDEISQARWAGKHGAREEKQFLKNADGVIVSSERLFSTKSKINNNCYLVKNGVDIELFTKAREIKSVIRNQSEKRIKVIGFLGTFDHRVDLNLLKLLAKELPEIQIMIVGRVLATKAKIELEQYNNVLFTGPKTTEEIPEVVAEFDIGIIPFVKNKFTRNIYPMKVNEYLAIGIPVVTTNFAPLSEFGEIIYSAKTHRKFIKLIKYTIDEEDVNVEMKRVQYAARNTWSTKARKFSEYI